MRVKIYKAKNYEVTKVKSHGNIQQRKHKVRKMEEKSKLFANLIGIAIVVALIAGAYFLYKNYLNSRVLTEVTLETGTPVDVASFLVEDRADATFVTDVSSIDYNTPGSYLIKVSVGDIVVVTREVTLNIVDTTAPTANPVPQTIYTDSIPPASEVVADVVDLAPVTITYVEAMGDTTEPGTRDIPVSIEDAYGNQNVIYVPFTIIEDNEAPVIDGAHNFEAFIGDTIQYFDGVTASDNYDTNPTLDVDNSQVEVTEEGTYPVTYTATDEHGNSSSVTVNLTLRIKPERYYEPEEIYELARETIDLYDICDESMSDYEITMRIFAWVSQNIRYQMDSDKCDWTAGAYDGLTTLRGDCYNYMAVSRAMLGAMGIESITVERYPIYESSHYWNLVCLEGQWYHCDACVFLNMTDITYICCRTDAELDVGNNSYDHDSLPEGVVVATDSIQDMFDFENLQMR